ncbi:uncharacterized protein LOC123037931 [Drosophila rhopaloa]|uniref:Reverse transcriptase domain-containing protein n=1 Tax=Drosophila rhopaloa TaxID=1041015 RepID=A0ABM5JD28_DRORH|nr:uncharacterized protein LOC123037931 [Drosophila rhopaloa]
MGKGWIYLLKKEDFAKIGAKLGITLEGRTDDKRKALSEYLTRKQDDPRVAEIWAELEEKYDDKPGPTIKLLNPDAEELIASLGVDSMREAGRSRNPRQERITGQQRPSTPDYAKVAKQVREWSFKFDGTEKPLEFLEQVEWSANTYGLNLNMIPRAMPELLQGKALKWFISNNKQWRTWGEFSESFQTYFLPRGFFSKLADKVKQRKQGFREPFKDYMVDMQTLMRPLGYSPKETLEIIKDNCTPDLRISLRTYKVDDLDTLMILADEYEELDKEREEFIHEHKFSRSRIAAPPQTTCRRCEDSTATNEHIMEATKHHSDGTQPNAKSHQYTDPRGEPTGGMSPLWRTRTLGTRMQKPKTTVLLGVRQNWHQECRVLPKGGKWAAIPVAERRTGVAKCLLSKLTGKLIEEEQQLSAYVEIGGVAYKATIDTGATSSFINEELADRLTDTGMITRTRRQVRLADGRCSRISSQLEITVKFGNKQLEMNLLILPGVVDELVLGWNFLTGVGAEIKCAGHELQIPARKRHSGCLEERLSVAVDSHLSDEEDIEKFLATQLADFSTMSGTSTVAEHQITMKDDKPIKQRYYPKNPRVQGEINAKVDELLQMGFIEHSRSPYSSPIVMVKKKTGKWRLCVDFRQINAKSIKDAYPMPRINYILDQLREAKYISSLDLKDGYWQVPLEANSRQYTAFTVPSKGLFQWKVMPFGLHSASATFQRALDQVIGPEMSPYAFAYQDDIIVIGRTLKEHVENLKEVFRRLKEANLRINADKCKFFKQELLYLGHRVTSEGIGTDPEKVAAIAELEPPSTVRELRQYLGVASWYRRFVPDFARIVRPLNDLLRKGTKWTWTPEHQQAFEEVKARLVADPVLACPDFEKRFILQTDASDYGLGAILTQETVRLRGSVQERTTERSSRRLIPTTVAGDT